MAATALGPGLSVCVLQTGKLPSTSHICVLFQNGQQSVLQASRCDGTRSRWTAAWFSDEPKQLIHLNRDRFLRPVNTGVAGRTANR